MTLFLSTIAIVSIIALAAALLGMFVEFKRDLMMLQQNSYRPERYRRWLTTSQDTTSTMRLVSGAVALAAMSTLSVPLAGMSLIILISAINTLRLIRVHYKKPLVFTPRARRIYAVMALLAVIVTGIASVAGYMSGHFLEWGAIAALLCYCFSHLFALAAV